MQQSLSTLNAKLEKLEERFAFGEIDREIFEKVGGKLKQEIKAINDEVNRPGIELSNPASLIDHSLEIISNLSDFWVSTDYDDKRKLQEVLFPGGVLFENQSNNYRTLEANSLLQLTHSISNHLGGKSSRKIGISSLSVLSHHRTYRSVYGGSLIYNAHVSVIVREKYVASEVQTVSSDRSMKNMALGNMPVAFPRVGPFPGFGLTDPELEEV